jgi:hypothetical protein
MLVLAVLPAFVTPSVADAQSSETNMGEVAAFSGGVFGLGAQPTVGGSTGIAFSRYGIALIEAVYAPLGEHTLRRRTGPPAEGSRLYDFNGSVHVRVPVRPRWAPYGILGGGLLFNSFRTIAEAGSDSDRIHEFNFGFHTGAGLRYHIGQSWGVRPEFKVILSNRNYTRFTVGIFYNLPAGAW